MSRQDSPETDKIGSSTSSFIRFVTEELKKISSRLDRLEDRNSSSSETAPLKLGPYSLRTPQENYKPAGENYSLDRILQAARQHCILKTWARDWYHKQKQFGWLDSYGKPVRSVERYLVYSWRIACKNNPDLKQRGEREADRHFAENGRTQEPVLLPVPADPDWKENQEKIQEMISQVRRTASA